MATQDVKITNLENGRIGVSSPYDSRFVRQSKRQKGCWDSSKSVWVFDERSRPDVEKFLLKYYGVTDGPIPTVDLIISLKKDCLQHHESFSLHGRTLLERTYRDSKVKIYEGVILKDGHFWGSGGSMKYPRIGEHPEIVIEVRDLPAVGFTDDEEKDDGDGISWKVVRRSGCESPSIQEKGYAWGQRVADVLQKRNPEALPSLSKRLFEIATKNSGIRQVFYLSAAYSLNLSDLTSHRKPVLALVS